MNKSFFTLVPACLIAFAFFSCGQSTGSHNDKTINEVPVIKEPTEVRDSIDILIEERAEKEFNSTIFGGLRFGSNKKDVEKALYNKGLYHTLIPIKVPIGDRVKEVIVRDYDAVYYKERLAKLTLYANEADLLNGLEVLFSAKYGLTKNAEWRFSNCEISIETQTRMMYHSPVDGWLANQKTMYYDSYRGHTTERLTEEPDYVVITYKSNTLLNQKAEEENDALVKQRQREYEERQKKREQEKELARKLSTEVPTNI